MTVRGGLLYVALWTPLILIYTLLIGVPNRLPIELAVVAACRTVLGAALLGLPARWWAARVNARQLDLHVDPLPWQAVRAHGLPAVLYAASWTAWILFGIRRDAGSWAATMAQVASWLAWQYFFGLVLYALIAGVTWVSVARERTRAREARLRLAEAERARAELAALRSRVEPHFLYNALHTATALVRRDPTAAEEALEQLATLLRYVLDPARGAREMVPLDEELRFVDLYLGIERARLGDRLRVVMEVDEEARDVDVPSLSLQPLVENAVRHGVAPRSAGGTITVRAVLREDRLELTVSDDGDGEAAAATAGTGTGLDALRKRLVAQFGDRASLRTSASATSGFTVQVLLPA